MGTMKLKLAGAAMVLVLAAIVAIAMIMFVGGFTPTDTVTVTAPRSGLVLDTDAKVKVRGVEIGRVASVDHSDDFAQLRLEIDPDQLKLVPENVGVDIRSTTVFGAKYVNFIVPDEPSKTSLKPGATIAASKVTVEFNTLFQHLSDLLAKVEPDKLNATMSALRTALEGRGQKLGELLSTSDAYLRDTVNPYLPTLQTDLNKTAEVTGIYGDTVGDLLSTANNATTTSTTIAEESGNVDRLLTNLIGLADTTGSVLWDNEQRLITALDLMTPTVQLLYDYNPATECLINGIGKLMPLAEEIFGGMYDGVGMNTNFQLGSKPYTYPEDLPKVNATGGPRCAGVTERVPDSHADYVVTDTSEGAPFTPNATPPRFHDAQPKIFQLLFSGLPGVPSP
ncbi:MCE family protein [Nocardia amikacinitolerans]|uniref:MCE family protein n=1 Tax=Nocardia amikacinitolerans TaxID=756689 RepID=UPI00369F1540